MQRGGRREPGGKASGGERGSLAGYFARGSLPLGPHPIVSVCHSAQTGINLYVPITAKGAPTSPLIGQQFRPEQVAPLP